VLGGLSQTFGKLYSHEGRPSIPPEQLLSALLLQVFYSIRSERQLMEQLDYNLLFRWFVGLAPDDPIWDATVFAKNRERLQQGDVFQKFMATKRRRSALDARTTRHIGYQISQTCRKMTECIFGWGKQHGTMRKTKHRGIAAVAADFILNLVAYISCAFPSSSLPEG
jgi:hypothetical protein